MQTSVYVSNLIKCCAFEHCADRFTATNRSADVGHESDDDQKIPVLNTARGKQLQCNISKTGYTTMFQHYQTYGVNRHNLTEVAANKDHKLKDLNCALLNVRSMRNKTDDIIELLNEQDCDIMAITETWLSTGEGDNFTRNALTSHGYTLLDIPRSKGKGGGVAILYKSALKVIKQPCPSVTSFELVETLVHTASELLRLAVVYRPPGGKHGQPISTFIEEFHGYLDSRTTLSGMLLVLGDFNMHYEDASDVDAGKLKESLYSMNLMQHVTEPTHKLGHCLDLVITREYELQTEKLVVHPAVISDHSAITFQLPVSKFPTVKQVLSFRKLKDIDIEAFKDDLRSCSLVTDLEEDIECQATQYNSCLSNLLEKHAPLMQRISVDRSNYPWFNSECKQLKSEKRRLERQWWKSKLTVHLDMLIEKCAQYKQACTSAKTSFFQTKIAESRNDQKALFKVANRLMHVKKETSLPSHTDPKDLAETFAEFFTEKIKVIRNTFSVMARNTEGGQNISNFCDIQTVSEEDIKEIIQSSNSKSCHLDPIPTTLLKSVLDVLLPSITKIVNTSIQTATFPTTWKQASVNPLIKKSSLDKEDLKNYRPISNLTYLSKIVEKTVLKQINEHMYDNHLHEPCQSAYRPHHSTETALIKIVNDILRAIDKKEVVLLVMLDMSAAFDTVEHSLLLERFQGKFGITGHAIQWLKSYFHDRKQVVLIKESSSSPKSIECGVPQGSILGPNAYPHYVSPLFQIANKHGVNMHMYADDTQLYVSFNPLNWDSAKVTMEACVKDIRHWLSCNHLKLNESKTEIMVFGQSCMTKHLGSELAMSVGDEIIQPVSTARNIGAVLDSELKMTEQVKNVCKACYAGIRSLSQIRRYLTDDAAATLVHAFVTCRLDNLNGLLTGIPKYLIKRLQLIQNHAARILTRTRKHDHITEVLKNLHWLPVAARIDYKVLLLTYKALNDCAPIYIQEMLKLRENQRSLRSSDKLLLDMPKTRLKTVGDKSFSVYAPKVWNKLPFDIKSSHSVDSFKVKLKTHLFKSIYVD